MSKKRKTRKEKIRSEIKLQTTVQTDSAHPIYSIALPPTPSLHKSANHTTPSMEYTYVKHDMKQTAIITSILLMASILLYIGIQTNLIRLQIFGY